MVVQKYNLENMWVFWNLYTYQLPIDFATGYQWEKIPLSSSNQEISRQKESISEQPLEEREDEELENTALQATEIEWLGFQKPSLFAECINLQPFPSLMLPDSSILQVGKDADGER